MPLGVRWEDIIPGADEATKSRAAYSKWDEIIAPADEGTKSRAAYSDWSHIIPAGAP